MLRSLLTKFLRDRQLPLIGWCIGLGAITYVVLLLYPAIAQTTGLNNYIQNLPPIFLALLGEQDLLSPAGFLNAELFNFLVPFVIVSCTVGMGVDLMAGSVERRTIELLLALPITRTRFVLEAFGAIATVSLGLGACVFLALALGVQSIGVELPASGIFAASLNASLIGTVFGSVALAVGTVVHRRGLCLAITATSVTASFFLSTLALLTDRLGPLVRVSPFYYYRLHDPLRNGLALGNAGALTLITLAIVALTVTLFRRQDIS